MKQFNKKGFTIVELISVIAIVAVLASILIPTFANVINKANDSAYQQERTNQMIKDVTEKVENSKWLSQEDFEKALAEALADNGQGVNIIEIIDDYYKNHKSEGDSTGISAEQVQKIIEQALAGKLTDNQVKVIIEKAVGDTLSEKDVKDIIEKALKDLPQTGITADELKAAVAKAVEGLANADEIKQLIDNAINNLPALTEEQIKAIIENAINNAESKKYVYVAGANPAAFDEEGNIYVYRTFAKLNTVELTAAAGKNIHLIIDAPNVSTINVNGEYSEIEVQSTAPTSTHIKGSAEKVTLNSGRVIVEDGATVTEFTAAPATNSKTVVVNEGTIETLYLEYQEHGYAAGNRDYIEVVNSNTVNAIIKASPDLKSGEQSTTNVVLEGVGTDKVSSDSNLPVAVEYTSGNKEYVADKTGPVAVESIEGVARIGTVGYERLEDAFDVAKNGETIHLLKDASVNEIVTVKEDISLKLELNGYTLINNVTSSQYVTYHTYSMWPTQYGTANATGRAFVLLDGSSLEINADGGQIIIPESNTQSYGFFRVYAASLTINGGIIKGSTDNGTFIHMKAYSCGEVSLNNVVGETNYRFIASDSQVYGKVNVIGGTYSQNNYGLSTPSGTIPAFWICQSRALFQDVEITSYWGECVCVNSSYTSVDNEDDKIVSFFKGNNKFTVLTNNTIQSWNCCAIGIESNAIVNVESGVYEGYKYGAYIFTSNGHLNITGGTFVGSSASVRVDHNDNNYKPETNPSISISGGTFMGNLVRGNGTDFTITGGVFNTNPTDFVDTANYNVTETNVTWTVSEK